MITGCPRCDYNLTGLPDEHICPECGFAYDANATSVLLYSRRENRRALIWCVLWMVYFVLIRQRGPLALGSWWVIGIFLAFITFFLVRWYKDATLPRRMIFTREGFWLYSDASTADPIPWSVVESASCSWWDGTLRVSRSDGEEPITYSQRLLGGTRVGKRCAAEINRLKQVYAASPTATTVL